MIGLIALGALAALVLLFIFLPVVAWSILGLIVLIIVLVLIVPIGADVSYIDGELRLAARANGFSFQLLPKKPGDEDKPQKEKKPGKPKKEKKPKPKPEAGSKPKKKLDFTMDEILELLKRVLRGVGRFGKITVNRFMLHYVAAGDDPYNTAVTYNYVNAALSSVIPICEQKFIVKDADVRTDIDFTVDKMKVDAELCITIRLIQVVRMAFAVAFGALGILIRNKLRLLREKRQARKNGSVDADSDNVNNTDNNREQPAQAEERMDSNG